MAWTLRSGRELHVTAGISLTLCPYPETTYLHQDGCGVQAEPPIHTGAHDYNEPDATPLTIEERMEIAANQIEQWQRWAKTGR